MRKLRCDEIQIRIQTVKDNGVSLLLYKDARVDRAILDETFGQMNWQNDFKVIDGKMYGGIGVSRNNNGVIDWIWKWDCGTESNTEAEKGQASDAFKRAGFKWGIGVELYSAPFIWVSGAGKYDKFYVDEIEYNEVGDISNLTICNAKTDEVVYKMNGKIDFEKPIKKENPISNSEKVTVEDIQNKENINELMKYYRDYKLVIDMKPELLEAFKAKRKELIK